MCWQDVPRSFPRLCHDDEQAGSSGFGQIVVDPKKTHVCVQYVGYDMFEA
jgi:hypothetical protein